jgi:hypothetical protein
MQRREGAKANRISVQLDFAGIAEGESSRVGVQIPDANFTTESLGVKDRTPTLDRRIPSIGTTTELP